MRFRMMLYHPPLVLEARIPFGYFDHEYDLEREHFFQVRKWSEWMRCHVERGYGNLTPCVRPPFG